MKKKLKHIGISIAFCLAAFKSYSQDHSNINIEIKYDSSEMKFLDTVEIKLQAKLKEMVKDKFTVNPLQLFDLNLLNGSEWMAPLTKTEIEMQVQNSLSSQKYLTTNKYELSIKWDSTLSKAYIMGFSRLYLYNIHDIQYFHIYGGTTIGPYLAPLFDIPLTEYNKFLSTREMGRFYKITQKEFIQQVTDAWIPGNDSISYRTIQFNKCDTLPQFNLKFWGFLFKRLLRDGTITGYESEECKTRLTLNEIRNSMNNLDTLEDENGNWVVVMNEGKVSSIVVSEKWSFDTANINYFSYRRALRVLRKIEAIGIITNRPEYCANAKQYLYVDNKPVWVKYDAIKNTPDLNRGPLKLYQEIIDADLYRKLKVDFFNFY